ncbi:hypothetical protein SDC9_117834 [bioreactor metagenome]|uniref:Uncharacterized protein n=1 Tax=bioreactor metagenome TaxID=1076179 RepID=A0A645C6B3_9ZZZZ
MAVAFVLVQHSTQDCEIPLIVNPFSPVECAVPYVFDIVSPFDVRKQGCTEERMVTDVSQTLGQNDALESRTFGKGIIAYHRYRIRYLDGVDFFPIMERTAGNDCDGIPFDFTRYSVERHLLAFHGQTLDLNDSVLHIVFEFFKDAECSCLVFDVGIILFREDDDFAEVTSGIEHLLVDVWRCR